MKRTIECKYTDFHCGDGYMTSAWFECFNDKERKQMSDGGTIDVPPSQLNH